MSKPLAELASDPAQEVNEVGSAVATFRAKNPQAAPAREYLAELVEAEIVKRQAQVAEAFAAEVRGRCSRSVSGQIVAQ